MIILQGLAPGQVTQRSGSQGSKITLAGKTSATGPVWAVVTDKNAPLPGWKKRRVGAARRGEFAARLDGIPAGGPYRLELSCGTEAAPIEEFFVGDVWILAGQSNMQGCGNLVDSPKPHPLVRAFSMRREWRLGVEPITIPAESPDFCHHNGRQATPEETETIRRTNPKGASPGLSFGREMVRRTGVPQGLICTAHGGTSMTQWTPKRKIDGRLSLYGSMLASVEATGQPVAGVLWYQGESDADTVPATMYTDRMKKLVASSRRDLRQPKLPWVIVQLARVFRDENFSAERAWNSIQEQQRLLPGLVGRLGVVAAVDLELDDFIHISGKSFHRLGVRLAREADRLAHGNRAEPPTPALKMVGAPAILKNQSENPGFTLDVAFDHVVGGLRAQGVPSGFALVDAEGRDLHAIYKTTLEGRVARLHLRGAFPEARVCYGHGAMPVCTITDGRDLALPVFAPTAMGVPKAYLPFITTWRTSALVSSGPLGRVKFPRLDPQKTEARDYAAANAALPGFVNEHERWMSHTEGGIAFFQSAITLPEPMKLEVLMGYDGPFRLWIDEKPFFTDPAGINPCFPDKASKSVALSRGRHTLQVAMDINRGAAWGFFLRFARKDVAAKKRESGDYAKPAYEV